MSQIEALCFQVEGGALKQNTFGKLPECLCFHVQVFHLIQDIQYHENVPSQRTGFGGGQPYKRHDYVEFPVLLNMDRSVDVMSNVRLLISRRIRKSEWSLRNQNLFPRYTHTSQLVKARAVSALGGGCEGSSAPSSLTSQPGLQQVELGQ